MSCNEKTPIPGPGDLIKTWQGVCLVIKYEHDECLHRDADGPERDEWIDDDWWSTKVQWCSQTIGLCPGHMYILTPHGEVVGDCRWGSAPLYTIIAKGGL
jgi:hypothetical protein